MSVQKPNDPDKFDTRIYWWAAGAALFWMLLLYWFTTAFNIPLGG